MKIGVRSRLCVIFVLRSMVSTQSLSCSSAVSLRMIRARRRSVDPGTRGATYEMTKEKRV
jgi:hypothetical protein